MLVDAQREGARLRAVEVPAILDPAAHLGIDLLGEAGQVRATATIEVPSPDLPAFRLLRLGAHGRSEAHKVASAATGQTHPEGAAEKVEAGVLRASSAARVLAACDLRLLGMQLEAQWPQPCGDRRPQSAGASSALMTHYGPAGALDPPLAYALFLSNN